MRTFVKQQASIFLILVLWFSADFVHAQNIAINTSGTAAAAANMLEVTQPATAVNNYVSIFASNLSTATNAYAIWAEATGAATGKYAIVIPNGGGYLGIGTTTPSWPLDIANTLSTPSVNARGAAIQPTFTGAGDGPGGLESTPLFTPSANLSIAYGLVGVARANPPAGVTISNATAGLFRFDTKAGSAGAVTGAIGLQVAQPTISGVIPTSIYGINIANQGVAGMTNSYGLYVAAQSGAANSYGGIFLGGNVGVGTATPATLADINKSSTGNSLGTFPTMRVQNSNAVQGDGTTTWNYASSQLSAGNGAVVGDMFAAYNSTGMHQNGVYIRSQTNHPLIFAVNFSTETMRITNVGLVGIGTSTPAAKLDVNYPGATNTYAAKFLHSGGAASPGTGLAVSNGYPASSASGSYEILGAWGNSFASNYLSVRDNGNVGIGITTPAAKLTVFDTPVTGRAVLNATKDFNGIGNTYAAYIGGVDLALSDAGIYVAQKDALGLNTNTSYLLNAQINGSSKMVITGLGNVGIGTSIPLEKLHLHGASAGMRIEDASTTGNALLLQAHGTLGPLIAAHTNSSGQSTYNGPAHQIELGTIALIFKTSPATAIGNARTFTEHMRLDNNGNLGIGTSSPYGLLHVNSASTQPSFLMSDTRTAGNQVGRIVYDGGTVVTGGGWVFQKMTDAGAFSANLVTIIQNTGNVGIGNITPSQKLEVSGSIRALNSIWAASYQGTGGNINAYTMEVGGPNCTSSGTEATIFFHHHSVIANQLRYNGGTLYWEAAGNGYGTTTAPAFQVGGATYLAVNGGNVGIGTASAPTYKLTVNGEPAANGYTAFTNYSDARLKKNITEVSNSLDKILKLRPVQFSYNEEYLNLYDDSTALTRVQKGFIAQEVQKLFPEMVGANIVKGKEYLDLNLSNLPVYIVKAMQEQQKMIDNLQKENSVLKASEESKKKEIDALNNRFSGLESIVKTLQLQINSEAKNK